MQSTLRIVRHEIIFPNQRRMIAALLQLHHNVAETLHRPLNSLRKLIIVPGEDPLVVLLLLGRHIDPEDLLDFGREGLLHILLDASY